MTVVVEFITLNQEYTGVSHKPGAAHIFTLAALLVLRMLGRECYLNANALLELAPPVVSGAEFVSSVLPRTVTMSHRALLVHVLRWRTLFDIMHTRHPN